LIGAANRQRIAIESIETSEWHIAPSFDPGCFGDVLDAQVQLPME
jgi:hypothetical protein